MNHQISPPASELAMSTAASESRRSQSQNHSQAIGGNSVAMSRTLPRWFGAAITARGTAAPRSGRPQMQFQGKAKSLPHRRVRCPLVWQAI